MVRPGLDAHYTLSVLLPQNITSVWMKFWSKAVLREGSAFLGMGTGITLKSGTAEQPFRRVIDLSAVQNSKQMEKDKE